MIFLINSENKSGKWRKFDTPESCMKGCALKQNNGDMYELENYIID